MRRMQQSAKDPSAFKRDRGHTAASLEGVIALQRLAGNHAVAMIARDAEAPAEPQQQGERQGPVTVTFPGIGSVAAIGRVPEAGEHTARFSSTDYETVSKVVEKMRATGTPSDVEVRAGKRLPVTLKDALVTSFEVRDGGARSDVTAEVVWTMEFKSVGRVAGPDQRSVGPAL